VDSILNVIQTDQSMDSETKSNLAEEAFQLSLKGNDLCKQILSRVKQATYLDNMGMPDSALIQLYWASRFYQPTCDSMILMSLYANLTNVYLSLGENSRVDSVTKVVLSAWNPAWKNKESRFAVLNNLGIAQATNGDAIASTNTFHQAFREAKADANQRYIEKALINLGSIKGMTEDLDSAYFFFSIAAGNAKKNTDLDSYMSLMINLANLDMQRGRHKSAMAILDSVYALADTLKSTENLAYVQRSRADLYSRLKNYKAAYQYLDEYIQINKQFLDEERVKAVTEMMEKYESEKKARQIQQLELDKLDATLKTERITNTRNRYLYIGIVFLLGAVGIFSRLQYVNKSRAAIQKEKDISEGLLLNILPASVAEELKQKGFAEAMHHDVATILFSDFKGFTTISETLTAAQLVEEINVCFKAFDHIMTKYGIEKIKTIGDAYMAAAGIPANNTATVLDAIHAAIEMQDFILNRIEERYQQQLPSFQMRIGLHTGSVVAGIVGVKKFQYDLWGDTVNIASRMESSGEVGKINISQATYQHVMDEPGLVFISRGKIAAKGKGEMEMYFVELAKSTQPGL
jgi:class 3 adenylate cyclase/tetratricopeptide (TPR) repeat protein